MPLLVVIMELNKKNGENLLNKAKNLHFQTLQEGSEGPPIHPFGTGGETGGKLMSLGDDA